jgi:hypothetical protein
MSGVLPAKWAVLRKLQTIGVVFLVLHGIVGALLAFLASERDLDAHIEPPDSMWYKRAGRFALRTLPK